MDNKTDFRTKAKKIRKTLDINEISKNLQEKIRLSETYKIAKNVLIFYPLEYEINLLPLISDNKNFYLPRISGDNLEICSYKPDDELTTSIFKTKEPKTPAENAEILDLIILPALATDKNNYRLGYGKGYFDRLLAKTNATTILPIPKELVFEKIPTESHDIPVDIVITT